MEEQDDIQSSIYELNELILDQEKDDGNCEYKCGLFGLTEEQFVERTSQMMYRIEQGNGETVYEIGFMDSGFPYGLSKEQYVESIQNITKIAKDANASIISVDKKIIRRTIKEENKFRNKHFYGSKQTFHSQIVPDTEKEETEKTEIDKYLGEVLIRRNNTDGNYIEIRIAVVGSVDSSKSTTIGVLTKGCLDNGNGYAREKIFNFKHEVESGRTSSVAHHIMGFDHQGRSINDNLTRVGSWEDIVLQSSKVITFVDLAGHKKYLKTTVKGFSSNVPDYAMILIEASSGILEMTREHIILCMAYNIPFFILITKIDICPPNLYEDTCKQIEKILSLPALRRKPIYVNRPEKMTIYQEQTKEDIMEDIIFASKNIISGTYTPIISISNVSGEGLDYLKIYLNRLNKKYNTTELENKPAYFIINDSFMVQGIGTVVHGLMMEGMIRKDEHLLIGPYSDGSFKPIKARSIHVKRTLVSHTSATQTGCINLPKLDRKTLLTGMVLVSPKLNPKGFTRFVADISVLNSHSTTIRINKYQTTVHILNCRQTAKLCEVLEVYERPIEKMRKKKIIEDLPPALNEDRTQLVLRAGMKARVIWEFMFRPMYFRTGEQVIFKEEKLHGIGKVVKLLF
jgi:GTPase